MFGPKEKLRYEFYILGKAHIAHMMVLGCFSALPDPLHAIGEANDLRVTGYLSVRMCSEEKSLLKIHPQPPSPNHPQP